MFTFDHPRCHFIVNITFQKIYIYTNCICSVVFDKSKCRILKRMWFQRFKLSPRIARVPRLQHVTQGKYEGWSGEGIFLLNNFIFRTGKHIDILMVRISIEIFDAAEARMFTVQKVLFSVTVCVQIVTCEIKSNARNNKKKPFIYQCVNGYLRAQWWFADLGSTVFSLLRTALLERNNCQHRGKTSKTGHDVTRLRIDAALTFKGPLLLPINVVLAPTKKLSPLPLDIAELLAQDSRRTVYFPRRTDRKNSCNSKKETSTTCTLHTSHYLPSKLFSKVYIIDPIWHC